MTRVPDRFTDMYTPSQEHTTLVEMLDHHAARCRGEVAYRFLERGETEQATLTYSELREKVLEVARRIAEQTTPGDRAILLCPAGLDFVVAFYACLYAGVIAVPLYPPMGRKRMRKLVNVAEDCTPRLILTVDEYAKKLSAGLPDRGEASPTWMSTDTRDDDAGTQDIDASLPRVKGEDVAFLQYTSGSTGHPKGVKVAHENIVHNVKLIYHGIGGVRRIVSWLPVYHDMGLIGKVLYNLYCGGELTLMSPVDFIRKPVRWLRAMTAYGAEVTAAPNFAYDLCVHRIADEELEGLDLSSMVTYCNGAEPIRAETMRKFNERFGPYGSRPGAFMPCYGLAENTLIVSGRRGTASSLLLDEAAYREGTIRTALSAKSAVEVAHSGPVLADTRVVIVDPESHRELADDELGEIWLRSPGVAQGYWHKPELTRETFDARLALDGDTTGEESYLRTGDLGFLHGDKLYVTGRIKELIIINGANHFPTDIEAVVANCHEALASTGCAVVGIDYGNGSEQLVVIQELERSHYLDFDGPKLADTIARVVYREFQLAVEDVVLLQPGVLPRTTSGKIQRVLCRKRYIAGEMEGVLYGLKDRD